MKRIFALTFLAVALTGTLPSCTTLDTTVQSGQSTTVSVTTAEKTLRVSKDTIDVFLHVEYDNREIVKAKLPAVHEFAESLRRTVPDVLIAANNAKNAYKHNRTPTNEASLRTYLSTLQSMSDKAKQYTAQIGGAP